MASRLWVGRFSPSFERSFLDALSSEIRSDPLEPRVVLVGSNLLGIHLRHELALAAGGHIAVRFLTFRDLAHRLSHRALLRAGRRTFPEQAEELLLEQLCGEIPSTSRFHEVARQRGFHEALRRTFHDLIDGGLTKLQGTDAKLKELGLLFERHRAIYLPRFFTTADLLLEAGAHGRDFREIFGSASLYVYGFYDLTETQRRLLGAIAPHVPLRVWIPSFDFRNSPHLATLRFFKALGLSETPIAGAEAPAPDGLSAPHEYAEAEEAVRWLIGKLERNPTPLHRAGILMHSSSTYMPHFAEVLTRAGIPFYPEGGSPLASSREGKAVLWLFSTLGTEGSRNDLVEFLSLFPFRAELTKEAGLSADWDRWTREAVVSRGFDQAAARVSSHAQNRSGEIVNFALFLRRLAAETKALEQAADSWSRFGEAVARFLETLGEPSPALEALAEAARSLSDLEEIGVPATPSRVTGVLTARIRESRLKEGRVFERDGLYLGSMGSARLIPFGFVVMPGLAERSFPALPVTDPLLLDHERRALNEREGSGIPLKETRLDEERVLFDLAKRQTAEASLLTYPRAGREGVKERLFSTFFRDSVSEGRAERRPHMAWAQDPAKPLLDEKDWLTRDVARLVVDRPARARTFLETEMPLAVSTQRWVLGRLGSNHWTEFDGLVRREAEEPSYSPTEISNYATCPYRYFLSKEIGLEPTDAPEDVVQIRPMDRGHLIHQVLYRFFSALKKDGGLPLRAKETPRLKERLRLTAEEVFARAERSMPLGHQLLWETERAFLFSDLSALLDAEIKLSDLFLPHDFEVRFGSKKRGDEEGFLSTDLPVEVRTRNGSVRLRGRVDRIDLSPDGKRARVIDYKTGLLKKARDDAFDGGRSIQLPVYLAALRLLLPEADLFQSEARLLSTSYGGGFKIVSFSGKALSARDREFVLILDTVAESVKSGLFPPNPGQNLENCRYCDFARICGRGVARVFERKEADPAVSALRVLEEIE